MSDTSTLERLEAIVARLEKLGLAPAELAVAPLAAVDPDGFPGHVAAGELIESAWGNATVDTLHRLRDEQPMAHISAYTGPPVVLSSSTWVVAQTGPAPSLTKPGVYLIMVAATVYPTGGASGHCELRPGLDAAMLSVGAAGRAIVAAGTGALLVATATVTISTPGSHMINAFGFTSAAAGAMENIQATLMFINPI